MIRVDDGELQDLWRTARTAWPAIDIDLASFAAYATARAESAEPAHAADLYLACACMHGHAAARETFARDVLGAIDPHLRRVDAAASFADEVRQVVAEKLLLGDAPKLAEYGARGPLAAWVRVVAVRTALNLAAARAPHRVQTLDDAVAALPASIDPELELVRARYLPAFRAAIGTALAALATRDRTVLRLHVVGELTTAEIGALYQVNQSTVVRWLAATRAAIRERTLELVRGELGVSTGELASLTQLILSRLDLSLGALLDSPPP